jgi:predicted ABC-type ATPase
VKPQLVFLAGPNGAGKSTFYAGFLSKLHLPFLNADVLEADTGVPSIEAARILDAVRSQFIEQRAGFITETVFSDPVGVKLAMLRQAVEAGYDVTLIYIAVPPELSELRIQQRVAAGGHDVPRERIADRFRRSLTNLQAAIKFVPSVKLYDNSSIDEPFRPVAAFKNGKRTFLAPSVPNWARAITGSQSRKKR